MKNKIICLLITIILVFGLALTVFADSINFSDDDIKNFTTGSIKELFNDIEGHSAGNVDCIWFVGPFSGRDIAAKGIFVSSNNCVLVRDVVDSRYVFRLFGYDSVNSKLIQYSMGCDFSVYKDSVTFYTGDFYDTWTLPVGSEYTLHYEHFPYCSSEENALAYFRTMDSSYLENFDRFIDVPAPRNVSVYKASEEHNIYLYWEQKHNDLTDYNLRTCIDVHYYYKDSNGNIVSLAGDDIDITDTYWDVETVERNQQAISYEPLLLYDTGYMEIDIYNDHTADGGHIVQSDVVTLSYFPKTDEFKKQVFDIKDNSYDDSVLTGIVNDYGSKNDSFIGGNPIVSDVVKPIDGDYGFLGVIVDFFYLLGDNGVLNMLGDTFSFIPAPIITFLVTFVVLAILISLLSFLLNKVVFMEYLKIFIDVVMKFYNYKFTIWGFEMSFFDLLIAGIVIGVVSWFIGALLKGE